MARVYGTVFGRFLAKIAVSETLSWNGTPCWIWTDKPNPEGYGCLNIGSRSRLAHRVSFAIFKGTPGPTLDHLCRHRPCVNPDHLENVTPMENFIRGDGFKGLAEGPKVWAQKTHCPRGHLYDQLNTYYTKRGHRKCRTCARDAMRSVRNGISYGADHHNKYPDNSWDK